MSKKASLPSSPLVLNYYVSKIQFNPILLRASGVLVLLVPAVNDGCLFGHHFWVADERFDVNNTPRLSALSQPLRMAAHASDWGYSLNQRRWGGKRNTMV